MDQIAQIDSFEMEHKIKQEGNLINLYVTKERIKAKGNDFNISFSDLEIVIFLFLPRGSNHNCNNCTRKSGLIILIFSNMSALIVKKLCRKYVKLNPKIRK